MRQWLPLSLFLIVLAGCGAPATVGFLDTYTTNTGWESSSARRERLAAEAAAIAYLGREIEEGQSPGTVLSARTELHPFVYYVNKGLAEYARDGYPASGELMYLVRVQRPGRPRLTECVVDLRGQVWAIGERLR